MVDLIGFLASLGAVSMWLPQAFRVRRHRHDRVALSALSVPAFAIAMLFNGLLLAYGVGSDSLPVAVSGGVNLLTSAYIVGVVTRGARS